MKQLWHVEIACHHNACVSHLVKKYIGQCLQLENADYLGYLTDDTTTSVFPFNSFKGLHLLAAVAADSRADADGNQNRCSGVFALPTLGILQ